MKERTKQKNIREVKFPYSTFSNEEFKMNRSETTSPESKQFKKEVLKRDNYTCQKCGGANNAELVVHHIYTWNNHPNLRYTVWNGITLCEVCHELTIGRERFWENLFVAQTNPSMIRTGGDVTKALVEEDAPKPVKFLSRYNDFGMAIITRHFSMPISRINKDIPEYQRKLKKEYVKLMTRNFEDHGYFESKHVELNELGQLIDGQQRVDAAEKANIEEVVVLFLTFLTKEKEAEYFRIVNGYTKTISSKESLEAGILANSHYSILLQKLGSDENSKLRNRIPCMLQEGEKLDGKRKFSDSKVCYIVNYVGLGIHSPWKLDKQTELDERVIKTNYETIRERINRYLDFFDTAFVNKDHTPIAYADQHKSSIIQFYCHAEKLGFIRTNTQFKSMKNKFRNYVFATRGKPGQATIKRDLIDEFNKGKREENKMPY